MKKKFLSMLLAVCLVITAVPTSIFAVGTDVATFSKDSFGIYSSTAGVFLLELPDGVRVGPNLELGTVISFKSVSGENLVNQAWGTTIHEANQDYGIAVYFDRTNFGIGDYTVTVPSSVLTGTTEDITATLNVTQAKIDTAELEVDMVSLLGHLELNYYRDTNTGEGYALSTFDAETFLPTLQNSMRYGSTIAYKNNNYSYTAPTLTTTGGFSTTLVLTNGDVSDESVYLNFTIDKLDGTPPTGITAIVEDGTYKVDPDNGEHYVTINLPSGVTVKTDGPYSGVRFGPSVGDDIPYDIGFKSVTSNAGSNTIKMVFDGTSSADLADVAESYPGEYIITMPDEWFDFDGITPEDVTATLTISNSPTPTITDLSIRWDDGGSSQAGIFYISYDIANRTNDTSIRFEFTGANESDITSFSTSSDGTGVSFDKYFDLPENQNYTKLRAVLRDSNGEEIAGSAREITVDISMDTTTNDTAITIEQTKAEYVDTEDNRTKKEYQITGLTPNADVGISLSRPTSEGYSHSSNLRAKTNANGIATFTDYINDDNEWEHYLGDYNEATEDDHTVVVYTTTTDSTSSPTAYVTNYTQYTNISYDFSIEDGGQEPPVDDFVMTGNSSNGDGYTPYNLTMSFNQANPSFRYTGQFTPNQGGEDFYYEIKFWNDADLSAPVGQTIYSKDGYFPNPESLYYTFSGINPYLVDGEMQSGTYFFTVQAVNSSGTATSALIRSASVDYADSSSLQSVSNIEFKIPDASANADYPTAPYVMFSNPTSPAYLVYFENADINGDDACYLMTNATSEGINGKAGSPFLGDIHGATLDTIYLSSNETFNKVKIVPYTEGVDHYYLMFMAGDYDFEKYVNDNYSDSYFVEGRNMLTVDITLDRQNEVAKQITNTSGEYIEVGETKKDFEITGLTEGKLYTLSTDGLYFVDYSEYIDSTSKMELSDYINDNNNWEYALGDKTSGSDERHTLFMVEYATGAVNNGVTPYTVTRTRYPLEYNISALPKQELSWSDNLLAGTTVNKTFGTDTVFTYYATNTIDPGGDIKYSLSANNNVATIDDNTGRVSIVNAGTTTITATAAATATHAETSITYTLVVAKQAGPVAPTSLDSTMVNSGGGNDGTITGVNSTMEYKLSTDTVWTAVTGNTITGLGVGTYQVRVKETANVNAGAVATVEVSNAPAHNLVWNTAELSLSGAAKTFHDANFTEIATSTTANTISYSSDEVDVATINESTGEVTIVGAGTTTITATAAQVDGEYRETSIKYTLTVNPKNIGTSGSSLSLSPSTYTFTGSAITPVPEIELTSEGVELKKDIDFTLSYTNNVDVSDNARITITGINNYTGELSTNFFIEQKTPDNATPTKTDTVAYSNTSVKEIDLSDLIPANAGTINSISVFKPSGASGALIDTVLGDKTAKSVKYNLAEDLTNENIGDTVELIANISTQNYTMIAVTITVELTDKANQENFGFGVDTKTISYGDADYTMPASGAVSGSTVAYESSVPEVATVDEDGRVTILKAGNTVITAKSSETVDYNMASDSYTLTVEKVKLTITAPTLSIYEGDEIPELKLTYKGFITGEDEGDLSTTPKATTTADTTAPKDYAITITDVPTDSNYEITTVNGTLTVIDRVSTVLPPQESIEDDTTSSEPIIALGEDVGFEDKDGNEIENPTLSDMRISVASAVSTPDKTALENGLTDPNAGETKVFLEISLLLNGVEILPTGEVEVFIPYSDISPITKMSSVKLLHLKSDNTYEVITPEMLENGIRFISDGLSPFLIYNVLAEIPVDPEDPTTPETDEPDTDVPSTGDNSNPALMIILLSLSAIVLCAVYVNRKKFLKENK